MKKVFCSECKHYSIFSDITTPSYHSTCKLIDKNSINYERRGYKQLDPSFQNRNNDCEFYEEKVCLIDIIRGWFKRKRR